MVKRVLPLIAIFLLSVAASGFAAEPLSLDALLLEARANNPELRVLTERTGAACERVPIAGSLDDPMLTLGFMNVPVDTMTFDRDPMSGKVVMLSQAFPYFGKRALKSEIALQEARVSESDVMDKALMVESEVKSVYFGLYATKKGIEVVAKNLSLMDDLKKAAEARYSVGKGMLKDIIKAQLEVSMLVDKRHTLEHDGRTKRAYLGSLLGRPSPVEGEVADITVTPAKLDRDALIAQAYETRPAVRGALAGIKKGGAMVDMARSEYYPDFTVSAQWMFKEELKGGIDQADMLSALVSINLPVWRRQKLDPGVRAAAYERSMAERMADSVRTDIAYKVDNYLTMIEHSDNTMKLYKDAAIPQATEDLSAALANYEVGGVDFMTLIESRRTLFDYELGYYEAVAEREKSVAMLEATVGLKVKDMARVDDTKASPRIEHTGEGHDK